MSKKHLNHWSQWLIFFTFMASSFGGLKTPATPLEGALEGDLIVAQASANLCRKVNSEKGLAVRSRPDPNSEQIGGLESNQQVTLAEGARKIPGPDGRLWVEIVSPINGYVAVGYPNSEVNLIDCQETSQETSVNQPQNSPDREAMVNLCRQVSGELAPEGLAIHAEASKGSTYRGGLPPGGRVMLVPNYQLIADQNGENRNWVQIAAPIAGFVAAANLIPCDDVGQIPENPQISTTETPAATNTTTNSTSTEKNPELCRRVEKRVAPNGLAIRANASSSAAYLGGVEPGGDVYLVPNYQEIPDPNDANRKWLQITAPIPGFISAGNLVMCR
ncbi:MULTISPECIES: SH3 domain-containing protein [Planktothricoides]|uniref:SH3 domain-containing protein n=2 Tax=Planktothricoides raciborskii TaxID=132608 RepID=A0AAU8JB92_9CYAN|nr:MULTISPECIES: SH3 domain-containing protein [Planktothricoides]MBD2547067.1 SH3 domain-containing protein [Planktothricoides raciborskii FACHB-1370]MBD2585569.1 SH3 domain-containing protein [Planktothricoides raciborskii FACHB-1261]